MFQPATPATCQSLPNPANYSLLLSLWHPQTSIFVFHTLQTFAVLFHILLLPTLKTPFFPTEISTKNWVFSFATLSIFVLTIQFFMYLHNIPTCQLESVHINWSLALAPSLFSTGTHWPQGFSFHPSFNTTPVISSFHLFVSSSCHPLADSSSTGLSHQHNICWKPKRSRVSAFNTASILGTFTTHYVPN